MNVGGVEYLSDYDRGGRDNQFTRLHVALELLLHSGLPVQIR